MTIALRALHVFAIVLVFALCACQRTAPSTAKSPAALAAAKGPARECIAPQNTASSSSSEAAKPADKPNPSLRITLLDCRTYDLANERGHWVVVNFWATWCGPCLQEIPDLTNFIKTRKDVAVIGLDFEDGIEQKTIDDFLKQHTTGYPIAIADPYHPPLDFDTPRALPTSYLIGPDGMVVKKFLGPITIKELQQQIDKAKAG